MTDRSRFAALNSRPVVRHGLRASFVRGCRCLPCRAAAARFDSDRRKRRATGDTRELVSPEAARKHLKWLSRNGIGSPRVAKASGVARCLIQWIYSGNRAHILRSTERRILAVTADNVPPWFVDARPVWRILDGLIEDGYERRQLARWLGSRGVNPQLHIGRETTTAPIADKVMKLAAAIDRGEMQRA